MQISQRKVPAKKKMSSRKAQAALEYIITYGWGFIVILIVLGGLAYFGYLNPTRYVPSRCSFGVQLECVDYQLAAAQTTGTIDNGNVTIVLRNNFGKDINITMIQTSSGISAKGNYVYKTILKGQTNNFSLTLSSTETTFLSEKDKATIPLIITFTRADMGGAPQHNVTGEIFAQVQKRT